MVSSRLVARIRPWSGAHHPVQGSDRVVVLLFVVGAAAGSWLLAAVAHSAGALAPVVLLVLPLVPAAALLVLARPPVGVIAVFLSLPIGLVEVAGLPMQLVQVAVVGAAGLVAMRRLAAGVPLLAWTPPLWWAAALLAWFLVALPYAVDAQRAQREVVLLAVGILFACTIVAVCDSVADVARVLLPLVFVVAMVATTTLGGAGRTQAAFGGSVVSGRALGAFGQPNELGTFCAPAALVAIGLAFAARSLRGRFAAIAAASVITMGLLLSLSRGAWIGFAFGVLVLVLTVHEARRALAMLAVPTLLLAFAVGALAPSNPQVEVVGARLKSVTGEKNPYDDRPAIWREAVSHIVDDPLTGRGPGSFPVVSATVTSESRTTFADHAHNLALTLGAEVGLPAVLLAGGLTAHLGVASRRARRSARAAGRDRHAVLIAALGAAGIAVLGQGLVDYTLRNAVLFVEVWGIVGALAATTRAELRPVGW